MQLSPQQLNNFLSQRISDCPFKIIWLEGKETLLVQEARDRILAWAKQSIDNRQLHQIDQTFDWQHLIAENSSFGLFDEDKIYDLRIMRPSLNAADFETIYDFSQILHEHKFVVISSDKLEKKTTQLKAFKKLQGFIGQMTFWPLSHHEYPRWIQQYARKIKLQLNKDTVAWLAAQHEGNLLALQQCLDRISFTCQSSTTPYTIEDIQGSTIFQAKYTSFDVVDFAIAGQTLKALKGLKQLQSEGQEPILILWAINNVFEALEPYKNRKQQGQPMPWPQYKVFGPRIKLLERATQRLTNDNISTGLKLCGNIDKIIKGLIPYNTWQALSDALVILSQPDSSILHLTNSEAFSDFCHI